MREIQASSTGSTEHTAQDLLTERRALVQEQRFERDATARAMLQFQIDEIDRALDARRVRS